MIGIFGKYECDDKVIYYPESSLPSLTFYFLSLNRYQSIVSNRTNLKDAPPTNTQQNHSE